MLNIKQGLVLKRFEHFKEMTVECFTWNNLSWLCIESGQRPVCVFSITYAAYSKTYSVCSHELIQFVRHKLWATQQNGLCVDLGFIFLETRAMSYSPRFEPPSRHINWWHSENSSSWYKYLWVWYFSATEIVSLTVTVVVCVERWRVVIT